MRRVRHGPGQFGAWPWLDRETLAGAGGRAGQGERAAAAGAQPDTGTWTWGGQLRRTHNHAHTVLQPRALALGDTRPHENTADSLALALGCPTAEHARVLPLVSAHSEEPRRPSRPRSRGSHRVCPRYEAPSTDPVDVYEGWQESQQLPGPLPSSRHMPANPDAPTSALRCPAQPLFGGIRVCFRSGLHNNPTLKEASI